MTKFFLSLVSAVLLYNAPSYARGDNLATSEDQKPPVASEDQKPPVTVVISIKDDLPCIARKNTDSAMPMYVERFLCDPDTRRTSSYGQLVMQFKGSEGYPVDIGIDPSGWVSGSSGGTMSPHYKNVIFDCTASRANGVGDKILLGLLHGINRTYYSRIHLKIDELDSVFISPEYIVYPDQTRSIAEGGPFATMLFALRDDENDGKARSLIVERNGKQVVPPEIDADGIVSLVLKNVQDQNDWIDWRVLEADGTTWCHGSCAFPVRGAAEGVVVYVVRAVEEQPRWLPKRRDATASVC
jgi:hypothetical protein